MLKAQLFISIVFSIGIWPASASYLWAGARSLWAWWRKRALSGEEGRSNENRLSRWRSRWFVCRDSPEKREPGLGVDRSREKSAGRYVRLGHRLLRQDDGRLQGYRPGNPY